MFELAISWDGLLEKRMSQGLASLTWLAPFGIILQRLLNRKPTLISQEW